MQKYTNNVKTTNYSFVFIVFIVLYYFCRVNELL